MPHEIIRSRATHIAFVTGIAAIGLVLYAWQLPPFTTAIETTENAYTRAKVTFLAPQVAGHVAEVFVHDFDMVKAGQSLVKIDDRIFRQKLAQAEAALASSRASLASNAQDRLVAEASVRAAEATLEGAKASVKVANANWERITPLLAKGVATQADGDATRAALDQAIANQHQAEAALETARQKVQSTIVGRQALEAAVTGSEAAVELARIDLDNTEIRAPQDGRVGEVGARPGQYVSAGTQLMPLVPEALWVVANMKETQLAQMRVGQPARITVDAMNHAELTGHVTGFAPATGNEFSLLKTDNATGNFTKVAQRLPVRIELDPGQPLVQNLVPGLSVVVSVDTSVTPDEGSASAPSQVSALDAEEAAPGTEIGGARF